jgi:hypothetical protein
VANGDSEFGIITGNLSNKKNVPLKMWRYSEYGGESSGDNSRDTCIGFEIVVDPYRGIATDSGEILILTVLY